MEHLLRSLVRKFGFKAVHEELEIVRGEYKVFYEEQLAFIRGEQASATAESASATEQQTQTDLPTAAEQVVADPACQESADPPAVADADTKHVLISETAAIKAVESEKGKEITIEHPKRKMKVIRKGSKTIQVPVKEQPAEVESEEEQEVVSATAEASATADPPVNIFEEVPATAAPRRTAAEIKKWQRDQEAARRSYMKANKISRTSLMTVENLRKWLEEGHTYARIAREQLGCKEEDVSKFAKEHGLQRKKN
jgi:hypothetical protein